MRGGFMIVTALMYRYFTGEFLFVCHQMLFKIFNQKALL